MTNLVTTTTTNSTATTSPFFSNQKEAPRSSKEIFESAFVQRMPRKWKSDDFEFLEMLWKQGDAEVFKARHKASNHLVAIKANDCLGDGVNREHKASTVVQDRNIVQVYGTGFGCCRCSSGQESDDEFSFESFLALKNFLVLELVEQGSLETFVLAQPDCRLGEERAALLFSRILDALEKLHNHGGMLHRGIDPWNLLVDHCGRGKLAGFGGAVWYNHKCFVSGSVGFIAPEYTHAFLHRTEVVQEPSFDVYGLGATLYWSLTGGCEPYYVASTTAASAESSSSSESSDCSSNESGSSSEDSITAARVVSEEEIGLANAALLQTVNPVLKDALAKYDFAKPLAFLDQLSDEARDLLSKLLEVDPAQRITLAEAKQHPWWKKW